MSEIKVIKKPQGVSRETPQGHITSIAGFQIGTGEVAFDPDAGSFTDRELSCIMLASFGMGNAEIGQKLIMSSHTVKTHLKRSVDNRGMVGQRAGYARRLFDLGIFKLTKPGESLYLTDAEHRVMEEVSTGKTNIEAGTVIGIAPSTVKSHIGRVTTRANVQGREQASLRALVAQDIGRQALYGIDLSSPDSWTPQGGLIVPEPEIPVPRGEMIYERN